MAPLCSRRSRRHYYLYRSEKSARGVQVLETLVRAADRLAEFPYVGRAGVAKDTRELVIISPYILIYRIREDEIQIVGVWHGARSR